MKDYELQLKIKNAPMLNVMRLQGYETAAQLSRECGIAQVTIGKMLNLKVSAYNSKGVVRSYVQDVADFLKVPYEMIYPEAHLNDSLKLNTFSAQVSTDDMVALTNDSSTIDPSLLIDVDRADITKMTQGLTNREQTVLIMRNRDELTLRQVGDKLDVAQERVRQIEQKALRKLRHPSRFRDVTDNSGVIGFMGHR